MLTAEEIESFRIRLSEELAALDRGDDLGAEERGTVMLDQQSVGRLSRMDALQRQAMAEATQRRREGRRRRIAAALQRIADGEFGYCRDCGEDIARARLETDPALPSCVSCASG